MDIFPCDNLSDKPLKRRLQFAASKLVIAGSLFRRGYITRSPAKKLLMHLSRVLPLGALHRYVLDEKEPQSRMVHSFSAPPPGMGTVCMTAGGSRSGYTCPSRERRFPFRPTMSSC